MSYTAKEVQDRQGVHKPRGQDFYKEPVLSCYRYPQDKAVTNPSIVSHLLLLDWEKNVWKDGFLAAVKSLFEYKISYRVILHQRRQHDDHAEAFVLFEAGHTEIEIAKDAFENLNLLFKGLLCDGQVKLTQALLSELVLPDPTDPNHLGHFLVGVIKRNSSAHAEWPKLFQALLVSACTTDNLEEATVLAENGASLEEANAEGDKPIHIAISSNSNNVLDYLLSKRPSRKSLEDINTDGLSPLELASKLNNSKAVKSLVRAGVGLEASQNSKTTALHRAVSCNRSETVWAMFEESGSAKKVQESLFNFEDAVNQFDDDGYTPLMLAVQSGFVESCFYLLLGGARPNIHHQMSGDTALHMAASLGDLTLVKLLTVFDAEIASTNHNKETTIDRAKNDETKALLRETVKLRKMSRDFYLSSPPFVPPEKKRNLKYLLSNDGGGIRNCAACQIMLAVEKRMRQLQPKCAPLPHYFDFFAGTSSGSYGILLFTYKNVSLKACWGLIFRSLTDFLTKPSSEQDEAITTFLKDIYGKDTAISDKSRPKVMVTTTLADRNPPELQLIRNYTAPCDALVSDLPLRRTEWKVWEAARASSAAPVYFHPFEDRYVDGGLMANNPTLDAMTEVLALLGEESKPAESLGCVVSLGNGVSPTKPVENIDLFFSSYLSAVVNLPQTLRSARSLAQLFTSQVTRSDGQEVLRARIWCKSLGIPYFRFSPPLVDDISLTETRLPVLIDLLYTTKKYIHENAAEIDQLSRILLQGTPAEPQ